MTQPATVDAGLESAKYLVTQGVLGIMCLVLMTTVILVFRMWMAERKEWNEERKVITKDCETEKRTLHEAHKSEMRENAKANATLLEKTIGAIDRVTDLVQHRPT